MNGEKDCSDSEELAIDILPEKPRYLTCGFWAFFLIALFCLLAGTVYSVLLCMVITIALWRLTKHLGAKYTDIMFPRSLVKWFLSTNLNRKYLRGVFTTSWGVILVFINMFPSLWILITLSCWFNPVLELDEMQIYTGVIERLHRGGRKDPVDLLWLKESDGTVTKFYLYHSDDVYNYLKKLIDKDEVKLWTQLYWRKIVPLRERCLQQLQHRELTVKKYNIDWELQTNSFEKKSSIFCALWVLVSCMIVWFKFNNHREENK